MSLPSIGIISELVFVTANVYNCRSHSQPCKEKKNPGFDHSMKKEEEEEKEGGGRGG